MLPSFDLILQYLLVILIKLTLKVRVAIIFMADGNLSKFLSKYKMVV